MTEVLSYGFLSVLLLAVVQWVKNWATMKKIDPLVILAGIAVLGGVVYALLNGFGVWEVVLHYALVIAAIANTIYQVLDRLMKAGGDRGLGRAADAPPPPNA